MSPLVDFGVVFPLSFPVRFRRSDSRRTPVVELIQQPICVKRPVGEQRTKGDAPDQAVRRPACREPVRGGSGTASECWARPPARRLWSPLIETAFRLPDTGQPSARSSDGVRFDPLLRPKPSGGPARLFHPLPGGESQSDVPRGDHCVLHICISAQLVEKTVKHPRYRPTAKASERAVPAPEIAR